MFTGQSLSINQHRADIHQCVLSFDPRFRRVNDVGIFHPDVRGLFTTSFIT